MPEYVKPPNQVCALDNANLGQCLSPSKETILGFPMRDVISVPDGRKATEGWWLEPVENMEAEYTLLSDRMNRERLVVVPKENGYSIPIKTCANDNDEYLPSKNALARWKFIKHDDGFEIVNSGYEDRRLTMDPNGPTMLEKYQNKATQRWELPSAMVGFGY